MSNSRWFSPQRPSGENTPSSSSTASSSSSSTPYRLSPRSRRQRDQIWDLAQRFTPRPVQQVSPGSLRLDDDSSTPLVHSAEHGTGAYNRNPLGFEASSPTPPIPTNLEGGGHYGEGEPTPPSRRNENEETPDEVISPGCIQNFGHVVISKAVRAQGCVGNIKNTRTLIK